MYCVLAVKLVVSVVLVFVTGIVVMLVITVVFVSVTGTVFVVLRIVVCPIFSSFSVLLLKNYTHI